MAENTSEANNMSASEDSEVRPNFLVGDQQQELLDSASAAAAVAAAAVNDAAGEDSDLFNQNMSSRPSHYDLAEKRKRLR